MLVAGSEKTIGILCNDLRDSGIPCDIAAPDSVCQPGRVLLMIGSLTGGFAYPENKTALITQAKTMHARKKAKKHKKGEEIRALSDITAGDLVVHALHGIGRFVGIRKLELGGSPRTILPSSMRARTCCMCPSPSWIWCPGTSAPGTMTM